MDNKVLEVFYIRHCHILKTASDGRHPFDVDVSDLGYKQIDLLEKRFEGRSFDAVLSSPMIRAVCTAAGLCKGLSGNPVIEVMPELAESGACPGQILEDGRPGYYRQSLDYLKRYYNNIVLCSDRVYGDENGNYSSATDEENDARGKAVINYIRNRFSYGQRVVVVAHGCFAQNFLASALDIPSENFHLSVENTSVSKVSYYEDGMTRFSYFNDVSHLRGILPDSDFTIC